MKVLILDFVCYANKRANDSLCRKPSNNPERNKFPLVSNFITLQPTTIQHLHAHIIHKYASTKTIKRVMTEKKNEECKMLGFC